MWLDVRVHPEAKNYNAFLNGDKLKYCTAANEEEGWADVYETDPEGKYIFTIGEAAHLEKKRLYGKIELKIGWNRGRNEMDQDLA